MPSNPPGPTDGAPPPATSVEHRGVDTVPLSERQYGPRHIFSILVGGNLTYSTIIFGSFPILFGLSWWQAASSVVAGTLISAIMLAPMCLFGPLTGTNNAVSSGAHFGVAGRFIGTFLALFAALCFAAITTWTNGDILVSGRARMAGTQPSNLAKALGYAAIAVVVVIICVRGIHLMVRVQERVAPFMGVVLLIGVIAFAPNFDASYAGGETLFGSVTATWIASALLMASFIVSFGPFLGDWTRYVHPGKHTRSRLTVATLLGTVIGMGLPFLWGTFVATTFADHGADFVSGLIAQSPAWYVIALVVIGLVSGIAQGTIGLYGTGLDASSLIPALSRRQATWMIASVAVALVYLGAFVWDMVPVVNAFLIVLLVVTAPWVIIMTIGYVHRRAYYLPEDLQVFTHGLRGGRYWFTHGWNLRAVGAWMVSSVVGMLFATAEPLFSGPLAGVAGGVDLSFVIASVLGGVLYALALRLFPEPDFVMPPADTPEPDVHSDEVITN